VIRRIADHAADAGFRLRDKDRVTFRRIRFSEQCGEVILEYVDALIQGIALAIGSRISGA
jgi:hypothetical protein